MILDRKYEFEKKKKKEKCSSGSMEEFLYILFAILIISLVFLDSGASVGEF